MGNEFEGFLFNNYFLAFYALALLLSIISYKKYFDTVLKYLPILIGYTLITEVLGLMIRDFEDIQIVYIDGYSYYNNLIFNVFDIIFFLFFFYVYWNTITHKPFKNVIKWGALLFILISFINPFFQDFILFPQIWASSLGSIVLIICILFYFKQLRSNKQSPAHQDLLFWISMGFLIFYIFYPVILFIGNFDYELYQKLYIRRTLHLLIAVMYSCIILGFVFMKRVQPTEDM
ncbi:MAG: hypothetical protein GY931_08325 [Maribacter sp.]|nr:hypothetical protein [Maribacter sp.]